MAGTPTVRRRAGRPIDHAEIIVRARRALSSQPRPFLRWAGSKQRLLQQIAPLLPTAYGRYFEPFLGGGAMYFLLRPAKAVLGDACGALVDCYRGVRDDPAGVLAYLSPLSPLDKTLYYQIRSAKPAALTEHAGRFIFLNRAGWNGLYRVNSLGVFNVPYGAPKTSMLIDEANLLACAAMLNSSGTKLLCGDFEASLKGCREGDFVFLDPPYVTGHNNNGFVDYNEQLFSWNDQIRLAKKARLLAARGVQVMVANANHSEVLALYDGFSKTTIARASTLAGDRTARRVVEEVVLRSFS